jgi:hypothetical protein
VDVLSPIRQMRMRTSKLALSAVALFLLASCSSASSNRNYRIEELNDESQRIAASEQQCIAAATERARDELSKLETTQDKESGQQILAINQRRSQELSQCEVDADHENDEVAAREQAEYEHEAREEHERATMISVIASQPGWH